MGSDRCRTNQVMYHKRPHEAYHTIFNRLKDTMALCPKLQILDNETPNDFKQAICKNGCRVEHTAADMHRQNAAVRAVQTYKVTSSQC